MDVGDDGIGRSAEQDEDDRVAAQEPGQTHWLEMNRKRNTNDDRGDPRPRFVCTYILLMKRSLFTPLPLPPLGFSVHISFTFSRTMLQCRSKALTRDQNLGVRAGGGLQKRQRASGQLMLLDKSDLIFPVNARLVFLPLLDVRIAHA
jgi:hypothetical protein